MSQNRDGTAAVVRGALLVTPPEGDGRRAVVRGETGIELAVPGLDAGSGPIELLATGEAEVRLPDDRPRLEVRVEISKDELLATMTVERVPGAHYRLEDQPPNQSIVLRRLIVERIPCPEPTLDDLRAQLDLHGVRFGVADDALERLARGGFGPEPVAKGIAAIRPRDGHVQIDALDQRGERFVRAGTVLARISAPLPGSDGMTVTGRSLTIGSGRAVTLEIGDGAIVDADGRVVAATDGHASLVDGAVVVTTALVVEGDVRSTHGEITSPGSIRVSGSIEEGSLVRAKRSITVGDAVRRSTVEAGGSLEITGAAFDSTLRVGHVWAALDRLERVTAPLARDVGRVVAGVGQVIAATREAGRTLHPVRALAMVLERVEPELEARIRAALSEAERERGTVPIEVLSALRAAQGELAAIRGGRSAIDNLEVVARAFDQQAARLAELTAARPVLAVRMLQKCRVEAFGSVEVVGKGVVDGDLRIVGTLDVSAPDAIFRGGRLDLDGAAVVHELSPGASGGLTIILAPGSMLQATVVNPGVTVELPSGLRRFATTEHDVRISAPRAAAA